METIHPLELGPLIETSKPIGIIDLRARVEFEKLHIEGAHSLPLPALAPETLKSLRELPSAEPFYLISASGKLAQVAVENLEKQGWDGAVVVEGGMKACVRDGLPVERRHTIADWLAGHPTHLAAMGFAPEWR